MRLLKRPKKAMNLDPVCECYNIKLTDKKLFGDLFDEYVQHIHSNYTDAIIVFDGYAAVPSTKDMSLRHM